MIDFAYSRLNLRFNPFGELDRQQKIENAIPRCDLSAICKFLDNHGDTSRVAVQFVGHPGSGKSTHLLMLANRFPEFHYIHIPMNTRRHVPAQDELMVDEAQRLTRRQRAHLFRNARKIALGTHRCFQRPLLAAGFHIQTISLDQPPQIDWLTEAFNRKIESARRSASRSLPQVSPATMLKLIDEFGNNIRGMERRLYETFHSLNLESMANQTGDQACDHSTPEWTPRKTL